MAGRWSRTFFALILTLWVCVLLASGNRALSQQQSDQQQYQTTPTGDNPSNGSTSQSSNQQQQPSPENRNDNAWLEWATFVAASVTAAAAVAYAITSHRMLKEIRDQTRATGAQAVIATGTLQQLYRQMDIADRHYLADHPPRLVVRYVAFEESTDTTTLADMLKHGQPVCCHFAIINEGTNHAMELIDGGYWIRSYPGRTLPIQPFYQRVAGWVGMGHGVMQGGPQIGNRDPNHPYGLHPGQWILVHLRSDWNVEDPQEFIESRRSLYVIGWLLYHQNLGPTPRRIAFCRRFDIHANRFVPVENSDYEHNF